MFRTRKIEGMLAPDDGLTPQIPALDDPGFQFMEDDSGGYSPGTGSFFITDDDLIPEDDGAEGDTTAAQGTPNPEVEALKQQLAGLQAQLAQTGSLGEVLKSLVPQAPAQTQAQAPVQQIEPEGVYAEKLKESFYDNPYANWKEINQRVNAPVYQRIAEQGLTISRLALLQDPETKDYASKYLQEIEHEVRALPPQMMYSDPEVYKKAYNTVLQKHLGDIIQERVAKALAEQQPPAPTTPTTPNRPANFAAQGSRATAPKRGPIAIDKIPEEIRKQADAYGVDPRDLYTAMRIKER